MVTRQSSRDIICVECPAIYSETEIIAARNDEKKPLVEVLGHSKAEKGEGPSKASAFRRLFGKDSQLNGRAPGSVSSTSQVLREKLRNLDRLKDWTFTCPKGHEVDGNRGLQVPLAVIGASGSSKSHFLPGMIWETSFIRSLSLLGITLRQGQFTSSRLSYSMRQLYEEKMVLPATPPDEVAGPFGYRLTIRDGDVDARYSLLLFDVGGEALSSIARIREQAAFVLLAQGLIVLVDPQHVVRTRFDNVNAGVVERERVIAAAKVRDSITLVADALEELWDGSMKQIPIPACFVVAKADSLGWAFDWESETTRVVDEARKGRDLRGSLQDSSDRVKDAFASFGGDLIIDEVEDRFATSRIRFAAASATGEMPEDGGWVNPTPNGISLALLHVLDMLGRTQKHEQDVIASPGTTSEYGQPADIA